MKKTTKKTTAKKTVKKSTKKPAAKKVVAKKLNPNVMPNIGASCNKHPGYPEPCAVCDTDSRFVPFQPRPLSQAQWEAGEGCTGHPTIRSGSCHECAMSYDYRNSQPPVETQNFGLALSNSDCDVAEEIAEDVPVAIVHQPQPQEAAAPITLSDMVDRFQKKIYLIDVSGSMSTGMAPEDETQLFKWTPEKVQAFRKYIKDQAIASLLMEHPESDAEEAEMAFEACYTDNTSPWFKLDSDDEKVKLYVVHHKLDETAGIELENNYRTRTESRIEAVRGAMATFADQRFQKYPQAQVGLMVFDNRSAVKLPAGASKDEVLTAIGALSTSSEYIPGCGGTNIFAAVEAALREFKKRPSQVQAHHLILVTDGEDHGAQQLPELLPKFRAQNVVFDFIFVRGQHDRGEDSYYKQIIEAIKKVCTETGGEYNEVQKSSDFKRKFLEVSNRRALPPARL